MKANKEKTIISHRWKILFATVKSSFGGFSKYIQIFAALVGIYVIFVIQLYQDSPIGTRFNIFLLYFLIVILGIVIQKLLTRAREAERIPTRMMREAEGRIANTLGYKRSSVIYNIDIKEDGSATQALIVEVQATNDDLGCVHHCFINAAENIFAGPEFKTFYIETEGRIDFPDPKVIKNEKERYYRVNFYPALKRLQKAKYSIKETTTPNSFLMTQRELEAFLSVTANAEHWQIDEALEYVIWQVTVPTDHLEIIVTFPKGYKLRNGLHFGVDYVVGGGLYTNFEEIDRVKKHVRHDESSEGLPQLSLKLPDPVIGLSYMLKWKPQI